MLKNVKATDAIQSLRNKLKSLESEALVEEEAAEEAEEAEEHFGEHATASVALFNASVFDRNVKARLREALDDMPTESSVLVALDIPYFLGQAMWDNEAFVGYAEMPFLDELTNLFKDILPGHHGMVVLFGTDIQVALLKMKFMELRDSKIGFSEVRTF